MDIFSIICCRDCSVKYNKTIGRRVPLHDNKGKTYLDKFYDKFLFRSTFARQSMIN